MAKDSWTRGRGHLLWGICLDLILVTLHCRVLRQPALCGWWPRQHPSTYQCEAGEPRPARTAAAGPLSTAGQRAHSVFGTAEARKRRDAVRETVSWNHFKTSLNRNFYKPLFRNDIFKQKHSHALLHSRFNGIMELHSKVLPLLSLKLVHPVPMCRLLPPRQVVWCPLNHKQSSKCPNSCQQVWGPCLIQGALKIKSTTKWLTPHCP